MTEIRESGVVGAHDAKTHLGELLQRVQHGEHITITRRGHPVARLVPFRSAMSEDDRAAAIDRMLAERGGRSLGGLTIRELIDAGRR